MHRGGDRASGRTDLRRLAAVGALLALAALALAVRRDHGVPGPGGRSEEAVAAALVLAVACWVAAYLALARTLRSKLPALVFSTAAFGAVAIAVMFSAPSASQSDCEATGTRCEESPRPSPSITFSLPPESPRPRPSGRGTLPLAILLAGTFGAALAMAAVLGYRGRRTRRRAEPVVEAPSSAVLRSAVEAAGYALRAGDAPRDAVIGCYAAMERALDRAGAGPRPSDSPAEVLGRAAASGLIGGEHAETLTELFRRARFSRHPVGADDVRRARDALAAVRDDLGGVLREVP